MVRNLEEKTTKAWGQYEAGCDYKRRIGLYETVRVNERFLRGDQWQGSGKNDLPRPVFNILRRVIDYMVCTVFSKKVSLSYTDADIPYTGDPEKARALCSGISLLNKNAAFRWERCKMDKIFRNALYDAAISGDGVVYSYFDPDVHTSQPFRGDIVTETVDNVNLFVADVNRPDIQSQEYVMLAGRQSVMSLRREAVKYGMSKHEAEHLITSDNDTFSRAGDMARNELCDDESEKATYLIKFWREDGKVLFEKSVRNCVIRRVNTGCRLYPVAYFNWYPTKNSFHGTSPITGLIPNQKFINRAYAMVMKHMTDTAFSKVIYDKSRIPEWTNEVGEAIAAVGTTSVSDAVSIIEPGKLTDGYMDLLESAINMTKELTGATDAALGNLNPTNTSAIVAVQEAAKLPLMQIKDNLCQCVEDVANIWADMMCSYYPAERIVPYLEDGNVLTGNADFGLLRDTIIEAHVEISDPERFSVAYNQSILDRLLDLGYITFGEYLERLPEGVVVNREALIERARGNENNQIKEEEKFDEQEKAA